MKKPNFNFPVKAPTCGYALQPNLHLLQQILNGIYRFAWPVERSKPFCISLTCWGVKARPHISSFLPNFIREKPWKTPAPKSRLHNTYGPEFLLAIFNLSPSKSYVSFLLLFKVAHYHNPSLISKTSLRIIHLCVPILPLLTGFASFEFTMYF